MFNKSNKQELPKDLGVKILSKEAAYWTSILEKTEVEIKQLENMLKFNQAIKEMCSQKIKTSK